ncbi:MAG TPA: hypothetical protein VJG66_02330 [Patescibacteria group bacterium]|nr:hypothetical protein [Patescibacteria group bacterium]
MKKEITITEDLKGKAYRNLITAASKFCSTGLFVIRNSVSTNDTVNDLLSELAPNLISKKEESSWPGTELIEEVATVYKFKLNNETVAMLTNASESLFSWIQPALPEDLCLIRANGDPLLVTISHEHDAFLNILTEDEEKTLTKIKNSDIK